MNIRHKLSLILVGFFLIGCSTEPFPTDWKRDRITKIPQGPIKVSMCFDMQEHSKDKVYARARAECSTRISEVETLKLQNTVKKSDHINQAEGQAFEGPIIRQKHIAAMVQTLSLKYIDNDKWYCPLLTPNKISFECQYDPKARDSRSSKQPQAGSIASPELPPELPDDLKPQ